MHAVVSTLVDLLPRMLWRPANLYFLPRGHTLHFCHGRRAEPGGAIVRTVELAAEGHASRVIAYGRRRSDREIALWNARDNDS